MYIIENNEIKEKECVTLGIRTGTSNFEYNWIDDRLSDSGIFYYDSQVYYKYHSVAKYILEYPHLAHLYNSYNVVKYIKEELELYRSLKNVLLSYNNNSITKRYISIKQLFDGEIINLDFFIEYGNHLLENRHVEYCSKLIKNGHVINIIDTLENILTSTEVEILFLKDILLFEKFNQYCHNLLDNIDDMLNFI